MAVSARLSLGSWRIMYKDFEKVIVFQPRSSALLWHELCNELCNVTETRKHEKPCPWVETYRPWPRHLNFFWMNYTELLAFSKPSQTSNHPCGTFLNPFQFISILFKPGIQEMVSCSGTALANASQSDNFSFHLSSVFSSHAAKDCFSTWATWLAWESISSQLSTAKPFPGHCLLKCSPESYHWYMHKNIPATQFHLQQHSPMLKGAFSCTITQLWEAALYHLPPHLVAARPTGVSLHPLCRACRWEQDHEQAFCETPVSTLRQETGFSVIITFLNLCISRFLSLLIGVCIALCTEMVGFFNRMSHVIKLNALQCQVGQCCYFYQSTSISKKKQYQVQQKYHAAFIYLCIQKSNQSAKPQQIRKYIQLFKFSKKNL